MGTGDILLGVPLRWTSIPSGGDSNTPSCFMLRYRNRDKLRPCEPSWLVCNFTFTYHEFLLLFFLFLPKNDTAQLKNILKRIIEGKNEKDQEQASEDLQEIMTLVQFANDECDYGMGLELGLDLFCFGSDRFHNTVLQLMPLAYRLLGKETFAEIAEIHVNNRTRAQLSQLPS